MSEVSRMVHESVDRLNHRLVQSIEEAERKLAFVRSTLSLFTIPAEENDPSPHLGVLAEIVRLSDARRSENPLGSLTSYDREQDPSLFERNEKLLSLRGRVSGLLAPKAHERSVQAIGRSTQRFFESRIETHLLSLSKSADTLKQRMFAANPSRMVDVYISQPDDIDSERALLDGVEELRRLKGEVALWTSWHPDLEKINKNNPGISFYINTIFRDIQTCEQRIEMYTNTDKTIEYMRTAERLFFTAVQTARNELDHVFNARVIDDAGAQPEQWTLSGETLQQIEQCNALIRKSAELCHTKELREWDKYTSFPQQQERREIISGRVLTHSAPNSIMYRVLAEGRLQSVSEQERTSPHPPTRTHIFGHTLRGEEKSDISFEVDHVYTNLVNKVSSQEQETA